VIFKVLKLKKLVTDNWLLLRGSIVQSVPCTSVIFWSILLPLISYNHSWFFHQSSLVAAETPDSETGSWREIFLNLAYVVSLSYPTGILTWRKILRFVADSFTSPPKEGVLRIFITLKNASPSAGSEPSNLGSNGKHANHYITEKNGRWIKSKTRW
jgi:hypothetical protein